jgi:hypothetical protein
LSVRMRMGVLKPCASAKSRAHFRAEKKPCMDNPSHVTLFWVTRWIRHAVWSEVLASDALHMLLGQRG